MDLRKYALTPFQVNAAVDVLNYQPFIISDEIQTGAAYSWAYGDDPRFKPTLVFSRDNYSAEDWDRITDTNTRLRTMYEDLLDEVSSRFPAGSLFDVACNNGYFPIGAELRGMRGVGMDLGDYSTTVSLLNQICGTKATFIHAAYDSPTHTLPIREQFDVVVASAIMCHLPDPLPFLAALGAIAKRAILFWGQIINTEQMMIAYKPPHPSLSQLVNFPWGFNDNTRISRGLFSKSMELLGFRDVVEIRYRSSWLPPYLPYNFDRDRPKTLEQEVSLGSEHVAFLALR